MMKTFGVALVAAVFTAPMAFADDSGTQSGSGWSESTVVEVRAGTGYTLTGVLADFDIFFYDADGVEVGFGIDCGNDSGTVPETAAYGEVAKYDDFGALAPCLLPAVGLSDTWTYTDGL